MEITKIKKSINSQKFECISKALSIKFENKFLEHTKRQFYIQEYRVEEFKYLNKQSVRSLNNVKYKAFKQQEYGEKVQQFAT